MTANMFLGDYRKYLCDYPDRFFQAVFTDPPYDQQQVADMKEIRRVCNGPIVMFCEARKPFFESTHLAYWFKPPAPKNISKQIQQSNVEWILIDLPIGAYYNRDLFWANYVEVYTDVLMTKPVHPYEKPVSLWERLMRLFANPDDERPVADFFMGSGSSYVAAQRLGLNYSGYEIDFDYFRMAEKHKKI